MLYEQRSSGEINNEAEIAERVINIGIETRGGGWLKYVYWDYIQLKIYMILIQHDTMRIYPRDVVN